MRVKLKGLNHVRKWLATEQRWEDYYYPWKGEGAPRLPGKPGSPEFIAAYHEAWASRRSHIKPNTVTWLIEEKFLKSQHYRRLKPNTRKQYEFAIPSIENEFGDLPLPALKDRRTRAMIREWRDSIADGTCETLVSKRPDRSRAASDAMADLHVKKFSAILNWGGDDGADANPCAGIEPLYEGSRLDKVWSWEKEALFLGGNPELDQPPARPDLIEAYLLAVWLGFREGDLVGLLASEYDGEKVRRELQKRVRRGRRARPPKRVAVPAGGPAKPILDAMKRRLGLDVADVSERARKELLLNSEGRPWASGATFYAAFHAECVRLGIKDRTFHDLRRTAVTRLAIAGCSEPEIKSITGHSISEIREHLGNALPLPRSSNCHQRDQEARKQYLPPLRGIRPPTPGASARRDQIRYSASNRTSNRGDGF